ncbi:MAG: thioredoxin-like domain-containing protein [Armatimonadota bacterium]
MNHAHTISYKPLFWLAVIAGMGLLALPQLHQQTPQENAQMPMYQPAVNAAEFPEGLEWLNTDRPLRLKDLRGKIVMLDFWTYCCINCMHIIPDLKRLEKKYPNELVVIGVHSAKFTTEKESENIRQAILRYRIEHPVVNDRDMVVWSMYGARAWPTVVLIDPKGKVVGAMSGEGIYEPFDRAIQELIQIHDPRGDIDRTPLRLKLEREKAPRGILEFPGKVLADERSGLLFIADSGHNRIVVVSLKDGTLKEVIGSGEESFKDGGFETAQFRHPQGMAYDDKRLYVADTENHTIRLIDFAKRTVSTVAGTGQQARYWHEGGKARETDLSSPWDVVLVGDALYIAMAGIHQLWKLDIAKGIVEPYAGSGREARFDSTLLQSALAQPSGITADGKKLYFADSECSSIRAADLNPNGRVETLVGGDLFDFGDIDGEGRRARLQHPLGVVYHAGSLYIADTYNNKIKRYDLATGRIETFLGDGTAGMRDGDRPTFDEPGGVSIANGKLYIADTNNHAIRIADLKTRHVETLAIRGLERLKPPRALQNPDEMSVPEQAVQPGKVDLVLNLVLPEGYKLNPLASSRLTVSIAPASSASGLPDKGVVIRSLPIRIPLQVEKDGEVHVSVDLYYCQSGKEALCYFRQLQWRIPLKVQAGGKGQVDVAYTLPL